MIRRYKTLKIHSTPARVCVNNTNYFKLTLNLHNEKKKNQIKKVNTNMLYFLYN